MTLTPFCLRGLPDHALLAALRALASRDADLEADLLVHLGEADARGLHLAQGYPSLFAYCTEALHFSESVAYHRITAARAARAFPKLLEAVRSGELHLSAVRLLAPHLTSENHDELLARSRHKSKRAVEEMLVDRAPKPDVRAQVRRLSEPAPGREQPPSPDVPLGQVSGSTAPGDSSQPVATAPVRTAANPPPPAPHPQPLGAGRYEVRFTAGPETHAKLEQARALLRHRIPDGDLARLFDRALDALLREARRAKFAECDSPREAQSSAAAISRHIPAAIRRAVAKRDSGRCTFVASNGRRCDSRDGLEFHHEHAFARSRRHRADEITLRCRAHNHHAAVQDYGADFMARFRKQDPCRRTRPAGSSPGRDSPVVCRRSQPPSSKPS